MLKRSSLPLRFLHVLLVLCLVLVATAVSGQQATPGIVPVNPTPTPVRPTLVPNPPGAEGTEAPEFVPPPTLEELLVLYPDLTEYLTQIEDLTAEEIDLADLYQRMVTIYDAQGAAGLAVFLADSGLLDKLNVPASYLDFLTVFDEGGIQAVDELAREREVINDQDELIAWIGIDDTANLPEMTEALEALGVTVYSLLENTGEVEVGIPLDILVQYQTPGGVLGYLVAVANVPHADGVRPPTPRYTDSLTLQQAISVGAERVGASAWHAQGFTGAGIRIGIIDGGYGGIARLLGDELPENINSIEPISNLDESPVIHGTAVAVVVHRAAPDAELFIATYGNSYDDWREALAYMEENQVQLVNYSVGSTYGPHDGTWGDTVDVDEFMRNTGALWVNSAGNYAVSHTLFEFNPNGRGIHDFGDGTVYLPFMAYQEFVSVTMNWDGAWEGREENEYRVYIVDENGKTLASGAEARSGRRNDYPIQFIHFEAAPEKTYYLMFESARGNSGTHTMNVFLNGADFIEWGAVASYSIPQPADSLSVLTVGATGLMTDDLEYYSSQGPTMADETKPDVTAPTGEQVPGYEDEFGFAGTSGSAPLVTGIAALVLQANPEFTAPELKAFLMENVLDLGDPGIDTVFGSGRVMLAAPDADTPPPETAEVSVKLYDLSVQYGVTMGGETGMLTNISFGLVNMAGRQVAAAVSVRDSDGNPIESPDANYVFAGTVGTSSVFGVSTSTAAFSGVSLFLPDQTLGWLPIGTQLVLTTGIYDVTDPANPVPVWESEPVLIAIEQ